MPDAAPRRLLQQAFVIGLATGAYGVSFGVLSVTAGLSVVQTCVLSLLMFTGASQFAVVGVLVGGGAPAAAAGNALLVGARNIAYGFVAAPVLPRNRLHRALLAHFILDETVAMARAQDDPDTAGRAFVATGAAIYVLWNAGTMAGALAGGALDPQRLGLDAMFPAAFLALLVPQLRRPGAPRAAVVGAVVALALLPVTPAGVPVLAASLGVLAALTVRDGHDQGGHDRGGHDRGGHDRGGRGLRDGLRSPGGDGPGGDRRGGRDSRDGRDGREEPDGVGEPA